MSEAALPGWRDDWALFLDVDGTILAIAATPAAVRVPGRAIVALASAHEELAGALALVSGRNIADLDRLFAPLRLPTAGVHGAERRTADGLVRTHDNAAALAPARTLLARWVAAHPGALLEDKHTALALHYRNAPELEPAARVAAAAALATVGPAFHVQEGKRVLEVKANAVGKGKAIEAFMAEQPFAGRRPVFVGDDLTDEDGFEVVNRLGGHSIAVGVARPTHARWRVPDEARVLDWLESRSRAEARA
jgi:trehalose 6-phosphate phosphatase